MSKGTVAVSLRSKGLGSFNHASFFDLRSHALAIGMEVWDVLISAPLMLFHFSWTSRLSMVITILAIAISMSPNSWLTSSKENNSDGPVIWDASTAVAYYLPFLGALYPVLFALLAMVFWRREQALSHMGNFKSHIVGLCLSSSSGSTGTTKDLQEGASIIHKRAFVLLDDLHRYLQHKRPYARHFYLPYQTSAESSMPSNETLSKTSRELGILLRKLHRSVRDLHGSVQLLREAGATEAHVDVLARQVVQLHGSVELLCNIKEMRSPVLLRALVRWFSVVILPVYLGFFCHALALVTSEKAAAGILAVCVQISLMALFDTVTSMEDPFDDTSMDTLSVMEAVDHIAAMTSPQALDEVEPEGHTTTSTYPVDNAERGSNTSSGSNGGAAAHAAGPQLQQGQQAEQPAAGPAAGGGAQAQYPAQVAVTVGPRPPPVGSSALQPQQAVRMPPMPPTAGGLTKWPVE